MTTPKHPVPHWLINACQGLTYWLGYKRSLYHDYPLAELAMGVELRTLIQTNLPDELLLKCEVPYKQLIQGCKSATPTSIKGRQRSDFAVFGRQTEAPHHPLHLIELKKASARPADIDRDLQRLADFLRCNSSCAKRRSPKPRAFLVVLAERYEVSNRLITPSGNSTRELFELRGKTPIYYAVRRTLKASPSLRSTRAGCFASILEVFVGLP